PPAPPPLYPLSLHDALPILAVSNASTSPASMALFTLVAPVTSSPALRQRLSADSRRSVSLCPVSSARSSGTVTLALRLFWKAFLDRKSTRLNSSHVKISYAV